MWFDTAAVTATQQGNSNRLAVDFWVWGRVEDSFRGLFPIFPIFSMIDILLKRQQHRLQQRQQLPPLRPPGVCFFFFFHPALVPFVLDLGPTIGCGFPTMSMCYFQCVPPAGSTIQLT